MKSLINIKSFIFLLVIVLGSSSAYCQVAPNSPPEDPVYSAIDTIIAHDLVRDVIIGQRPYSRLEIARILKKARQVLGDRMNNDEAADLNQYHKIISSNLYLNKLITYYEKEYKRELDGMNPSVEFNFLSQMDFTTLYNNSNPRQIPVANGQGSIDGMVTSFDKYSQGVTYLDGGSFYLNTKHELYLSPYFALNAEPRFEFLFPKGSSEDFNARVHRLYAKTGVSNFEFEIGRDNLTWGQGEYGGMMISTSARPLDMIKLSNPYPLKLPWALKHLGSMKWTFFVSNLGPEHEFSYPYFYGLKWSVRPSRHVEFGLSETVIMGGNKAPSIDWWDPIGELFPFHKIGGKNIGAKDVSDHAFGIFDIRVTIPPLRNSMIYYDGYIEDSLFRAFRLPDNILNQMGFIAGAYVPRLTNKGDLGLRLEYHHTPPLQYRHSRWISGYTLNKRVMGDPLGPDTDGVYTTLYWRPQSKILGRLEFAYEDYDSSHYYTETNEHGGGDRIIKDKALPHERRYRMVLGADWQKNKRYALKVSAGYERIENFNFDVGKSVNNVMLEAVLSLKFDEFRISNN